MLARLIKFIKENYPDSNLDDWLDSKYIHLSNPQLKKIADAHHRGELDEKLASNCPTQRLIFHFGDTLILIKKDKSEQYVYQAELAWETDFQSLHSPRQKNKGFHFINFAFDDIYQTTILSTQKILKGTFIDTKASEKIVNKSMPILKAFMCAIS